MSHLSDLLERAEVEYPTITEVGVKDGFTVMLPTGDPFFFDLVDVVSEAGLQESPSELSARNPVLRAAAIRLTARLLDDGA